MKTKRCPRCGEIRPRTNEFFGPRTGWRRGPNAIRPYCRECERIKLRERNDYLVAYHRKWRAEHREHYNAQANSYYTSEKRRTQYLKHKKSELASARKRYIKDPNRYYEWTKAWRKNNPEKICALFRSYGARRRGAEGSFDETTIRRLWWFQGGRCQYCSRRLKKDTYHVDHMIPLSRIELSPTNLPLNLCLACPCCNSRKHDKTADEFYAVMGK